MKPHFFFKSLAYTSISLAGAMLGTAQASPNVALECWNLDHTEIAHLDNLALPDQGAFSLLSTQGTGSILMMVQGTLDPLRSNSTQMTFDNLKHVSFLINDSSSGTPVSAEEATSVSVMFSSNGDPASLLLEKTLLEGQTVQMSYATDCAVPH